MNATTIAAVARGITDDLRAFKVQGRLPQSLEADLRAGTVRFERPSNFTPTVVMAFELYECALFCRQNPQRLVIGASTI